MSSASLERVARLALWSGPVTPEPLAGGISNENFKVMDRGRASVVRVADDVLAHGVLRSNELAASRAAAAAGISPAVIHHEPGILVIDYIEARAFTAEDVRNPANAARIADLIRHCHHDIPRHLRGPGFMFWPFHVLRDYAHTLTAGRSPHVGDLPALLSAADRLEAAVGPIEVVFGHNDLLPANILDDGSRLWLVDWEYSGFNSPLFDLGGVTSNAEMDPDASRALIEHYLGHPIDADFQRRLDAMTAASLLRETMWSMVSEIHSKLAFDYGAYTADNRARFAAAYQRFLDGPTS
jgi:thiamine kinase-like enzyme